MSETQEPELAEGHAYHECPVCGPQLQALVVRLTEAEYQRMVHALHKSRFGEQGYYGQEECEQIAEAVVPAVVRAKTDAFHSGLRWEGRAHEARTELAAARQEIERLKRLLALHLFDKEALSTREAIRSELIVQGIDATEELETLRQGISDLSRSVYNGAPDPLQEFYNRGFGQWLQNEVDRLLETTRRRRG